MKRFKTILLAAMMVMVGLASSKAMAKGMDSAEANFTFVLPLALSVAWDAIDSGQYINLTGANEITPQEISAGYKESIYGGTLIVSANVGWVLAASAGADYFYNTEGESAKTVSDLAISTQYDPTYTSLNGTLPVSILTDMESGANIPVVLNYKLNVSGDDEAEVYSTTINYTILPQ